MHEFKNGKHYYNGVEVGVFRSNLKGFFKLAPIHEMNLNLDWEQINYNGQIIPRSQLNLY